MLAAGDTFRAAAIGQLAVWAERIGVPIVKGPEGGDPASIVFDAVKLATEKGTDALIVDTAGRLQNKRELMDELAKIRRVLGRLNPAAPHDVVLVLDATNGQNALSQIDVFKEVAGVTGLIMTKLDGTARGGVLVAAAEQYGLPIHAIGVGEKLDDLRPFDPDLVARVIAWSGMMEPRNVGACFRSRKKRRAELDQPVGRLCAAAGVPRRLLLFRALRRPPKHRRDPRGGEEHRRLHRRLDRRAGRSPNGGSARFRGCCGSRPCWWSASAASLILLRDPFYVQIKPTVLYMFFGGRAAGRLVERQGAAAMAARGRVRGPRRRRLAQALAQLGVLLLRPRRAQRNPAPEPRFRHLAGGQGPGLLPASRSCSPSPSCRCCCKHGLAAGGEAGRGNHASPAIKQRLLAVMAQLALSGDRRCPNGHSSKTRRSGGQSHGQTVR